MSRGYGDKGDAQVDPSSPSSGHGSVNHVVCNVTGPCSPCTQTEKDEDWSVCRSTGYRQPITCLLLPSENSAEETPSGVDGSMAGATSEGNLARSRKKRTGLNSRRILEDEEQDRQQSALPPHDSEFEMELSASQSDGERSTEDESRVREADSRSESEDVLVPASVMREAGRKDKTNLEKIAMLIPAHWRRRLFFEEKQQRGKVSAERRFSTYQSCSLETSAAGKETVSVLVFEGICLVLLGISVPVIVIRKNQLANRRS